MDVGISPLSFMRSPAVGWRDGEPICGVLDLRGAESSIVVGRTFCSNQERMLAECNTILSYRQCDDGAAYELPLLSVLNFQDKRRAPLLSWG